MFFIIVVIVVPIVRGCAVAFRRQLCGVHYLLPPLPSFWGLKSGPQVLMPAEPSYQPKSKTLALLPNPYHFADVKTHPIGTSIASM